MMMKKFMIVRMKNSYQTFLKSLDRLENLSFGERTYFSSFLVQRQVVSLKLQLKAKALFNKYVLKI
jgi:hypothetical protein